MGVLFFCIALVATAVILHLIALRIKMPVLKSPIITTLFIFFVVLICGLVLAGVLYKQYSFLPHGFWQYLHVIIFYIPVMFSYIITYVVMEDDSPSMTIARFVDMAKEKGRSRDEIGQIITDESLIWPRINAMVKNGWIEYKNNRYFITPKGLFHSRFFALGLKFLNINREG